MRVAPAIYPSPDVENVAASVRNAKLGVDGPGTAPVLPSCATPAVAPESVSRQHVDVLPRSTDTAVGRASVGNVGVPAAVSCAQDAAREMVSAATPASAYESLLEHVRWRWIDGAPPCVLLPADNNAAARRVAVPHTRRQVVSRGGVAGPRHSQPSCLLAVRTCVSIRGGRLQRVACCARPRVACAVVTPARACVCPLCCRRRSACFGSRTTWRCAACPARCYRRAGGSA